MVTAKIEAGAIFPKISVKTREGNDVVLGKPAEGSDWQMVIVYRGRHCPMCTRYLNKLEDIKQGLKEISIDLVAVSGDNSEQLESHIKKLDVSFPLYHSLTVAQMQELGLYISIPRSEKETDHNFPEPGMFVVNQDGNVQVVDVSNNPFARPEVDILLSGLKWIRDPENNYPIRGTYK